MGSTIVVFIAAATVLFVGLWVGWLANRTFIAHGDVQTARGRIKGYRRNRLRSGIIALVFIIVGLLFFADMVRH